jgi:ribosomal protein S3AE
MTELNQSKFKKEFQQFVTEKSNSNQKKYHIKILPLEKDICLEKEELIQYPHHKHANTFRIHKNKK